MATLSPSRALVYWATPEDWTRGGDPEASLALLSDDERARMGRFHFERDRELFLTAHGLLRQVLSAHTGQPARDLTFERGEHGRPELAGPQAGALRFNLSHTEGLVAVVVHPTADCGVDVERVGRRTDALKVAERFFSPEEVAGLHAQPAERRRMRFFELWTLKEAYIKARGLGLALPLRRFSFRLDDPPPIRLTCEPDVDPAPEDWWFRQQAHSEDHLLAVAIRCPRGETMTADLRQIPRPGR